MTRADRWIIGIGGLVLGHLMLCIIGCAGGGPTSAFAGVTRPMIDRLGWDMTIDQVNASIGYPGELVWGNYDDQGEVYRRYEWPGIPSQTGRPRIFYCTFREGRLIAKSDLHLIMSARSWQR